MDELSPDRTPLPADARRVVALCSVALLLDTTFFAVLSPLLAGYADSAGLSESGVGLLVAAYPLGFVLAAFPAGSLIGRRGPRTMLLVGLGLVALACVLFAFASTGPQLIGFRFLQGIGGIVVWASAMSWPQAVAPSGRRGEIAGTILGAGIVGSILGPVLGALASVVGTTPVFVALAVVFLGIAGLALRHPAIPSAPSPGWRHALGLLRDHRVRLGIWLLCFGGIVTGAINTLAPLTLAGVGLGTTATSAVFLVMAAAAALTSPRVGRRSDRHGRAVVAVVILAGGAVIMLGTGLVSAAGGPLALLVVLLVAGFVLLEAGYVPGSALIADGSAHAEASRGELLALGNFCWAVGMTAASLLAGVLLSHLGVVAPYAAVALCAVVAVPEFVVQARRTPSG